MKKTFLTSALFIFSLATAMSQVETIFTHDGLPGDYFGASVSIDENHLMVGSPGKTAGIFPNYINHAGMALIYEKSLITLNWEYIGYLAFEIPAIAANLGASVSISEDVAIAGAPGYTWQFEDQGGICYSTYPNWNAGNELIPSNSGTGYNFGRSVDLARNYTTTVLNYMIIGSPHGGPDSTGVINIYYWTMGMGLQFLWSYTPPGISKNDYFGFSVAVNSGDPLYFIAGAPEDEVNGIKSGSAFIYNSTGDFVQLIPYDGHWGMNFGDVVDIDTSIAVVSAPNDNDNGSQSGSVYIYERNGVNWNFSQKLLASDGSQIDKFGTSVSLNLSNLGASLLVGAPGESSYKGAAYLFKKEGGVWSEVAKITASDGSFYDLYGSSVSLTNGYAAIGAPGAYVPGNGEHSGKVYLYEGINTGILDPDPDELLFGYVQVGSSLTKTITIHNPGLITLNIDSVSVVGPDAQHFSVPSSSVVLAAGESIALDVTFTPTVYGNMNADLGFGADIGWIPIPIFGSGSTTLIGNPAEINFGEVRIGYISADSLGLYNAGNNPITIDSVVVTGDYINFQVTIPTCPFPISPYETGYLPVAFEPPVAGNYEAQVSAFSPSGAVEMPLTGEGILAGQISIAADTIDFGTTSPSMEVIDTVFVSNIGSYSIAINDVYKSGPNQENFEVLIGMLPITLPAGSYLPLLACFEPSDTTQFFATFHVVSNGGTDLVVLTGCGTDAPLLQVAPHSFDFGDAPNGHTYTQTLAIGNFGLNDLHVGPISITGNNPGNFSINTTPFTLEPTYIEHLDVNFQPDASVSFDALLTVQSNGGQETIALTGSGFSILPSGETKVAANPDVYMGHVSVSSGHGLASFAQFYRANGNSWFKTADFNYPFFTGNGSDVALNGLYACVGTPYDTIQGEPEAGGVRMYKLSGSSWNFLDILPNPDPDWGDRFGHALDFDGNHLIVGMSYDDEYGWDMGSAYIFAINSFGISSGFKIYPTDQQAYPSFGLYVALSGDYAIVGRPMDDANGLFSGAVYVFKKNLWEYWSQHQKLFASDAGMLKSFGGAVAVDGDYMIIGSPGNENSGSGGAAYIFHLNAGTWQEEAILMPEHISESFGYAVSISGDYALVGTPYATFPLHYEAGAAWLFKRDGTDWVEQRMIRPDDAHQDHHFGNAVDIDSQFLTMMIATKEGEIYFYGDSTFLGIDNVTFGKPEFTMLQNIPNPFSKETSIHFELPRSEYVILDIYTVFGEKIDELIDRKLQAGKYNFTWNALNATEGLYFCKLQAGEFVATKKMLLMK